MHQLIRPLKSLKSIMMTIWMSFLFFLDKNSGYAGFPEMLGGSTQIQIILCFRILIMFLRGCLWGLIQSNHITKS